MLLELININKKYNTDLGIENINITLNKGESLAVMGRSGSGKSTLLRLIALFESPDSGSVLYKGVENSKELLNDLGYIFQRPERQLFEKTTERDIAFALRKSGLSRDEIKKRVLEASSLAGFPPSLLRKSPFMLSGGEARKAALAGIYIKRPKLLLLDEASSGLDSSSREKLLSTIMGFKKEGSGVIAATHSSEEAALFDKLLILDNGRVKFYGKVSDAFSSSRSAISLGLDPPFALALSEKLQMRDADVMVTYKEDELKKALDSNG